MRVEISSSETAALCAVTQSAADGDCVTIRGVRLPLDGLVNRDWLAPERQPALREQLANAHPFPHLVIEGLFHPQLLALVAEEFDAGQWTDVRSHYESTRRSVLGTRLGPASQLYFDVLHSGWFSAWLSSLTGVPYLLADPKLFGGGLHESQAGATFAVHRDFHRHRHLGLKNEMVFITYLNKGWQPQWGAALELWDARRQRCEKRIWPEFGHTLLMPHSARSFHGHPDPMRTPPGQVRRSVAAYYYTSPDAGKTREDEVSSVFLRIRRFDRVKRVAQMLAPPLLWSAVRKMARR